MEKRRGRKKKEVIEAVKHEANELLNDIKEDIQEEVKEHAKGLGDTLEKVFEKTGVAKVVKWLAGDDCGCDERKKRLNELFPYRKPNCLNEDEFNILDGFFSKNTAEISPSDQNKLLSVYNRVLNLRQEPTSCGSCWRDIIAKLKVLHKEYANS